ncbi:hypothetical protein [Dawidia soli]|uniref:Uncharacterized protein n=1 Tax=Dawidia soli TaxID=2782352 RepID=A0AAP2DFU9_9BACT|nr:hypothetical protein [Dawidia soli]MBT1690326.1 hypothetical protein [Dawidia soli]
MKTKTAKTKKSAKQKPAATKDQPEHQKPRKAEAGDGAQNETPEPPQMMHPLSDEERKRKKDEDH